MFPLTAALAERGNGNNFGVVTSKLINEDRNYIG